MIFLQVQIPFSIGTHIGTIHRNFCSYNMTKILLMATVFTFASIVTGDYTTVSQRQIVFTVMVFTRRISTLEKLEVSNSLKTLFYWRTHYANTI